MGIPRKLTWTTCTVCGRIMPVTFRRVTCSQPCTRARANYRQRKIYRDLTGQPRRTRPRKTGILNLLDK